MVNADIDSNAEGDDEDDSSNDNRLNHSDGDDGAASSVGFVEPDAQRAHRLERSMLVHHRPLRLCGETDGWTAAEDRLLLSMLRDYLKVSLPGRECACARCSHQPTLAATRGATRRTSASKCGHQHCTECEAGRCSF